MVSTSQTLELDSKNVTDWALSCVLLHACSCTKQFIQTLGVCVCGPFQWCLQSLVRGCQWGRACSVALGAGSKDASATSQNPCHETRMCANHRRRKPCCTLG